MSDNAEVAVAAATPKKTKAASKPKAKKPKTAPTHPKVSEMVNNAITTLKERGGSSLAAIKKFIASTYKVDVEKLSTFIRKYLKSAVAAGTLVQTKGKGANGSFRMGGSVKEKSVAKPKKSAASTPKKAKAKKVAKPKKVTPKKPKKAATPKKAKSTAAKKSPAKKPKAAKPKSAAKPKKSPAKKTPKKTAAKKGKK